MIGTIKLVVFSPTGTTRKAVEAIAKGMNPSHIDVTDITRPDARQMPFESAADDLLIIGVPVYMGRVPSLLSEWLDSIELHNTPAVCVVVYGNRAYEDALLELKDIVKKRGGIPIAGGAYIGEHSFSNDDTPSLGRPDADDLRHAKDFSEKILAKLNRAASCRELSEAAIPGTYPYGGLTELWDVDFIAVSDACTQCGTCEKVCPMGAISPESSSIVDQHKCITCCACIKTCPQKARSMKPGLVKDAQHRINTLFVDRKEPEVFL